MQKLLKKLRSFLRLDKSVFQLSVTLSDVFINK